MDAAVPGSAAARATAARTSRSARSRPVTFCLSRRAGRGAATAQRRLSFVCHHGPASSAPAPFPLPEPRSLIPNQSGRAARPVSDWGRGALSLPPPPPRAAAIYRASPNHPPTADRHRCRPRQAHHRHLSTSERLPSSLLPNPGFGVRQAVRRRGSSGRRPRSAPALKMAAGRERGSESRAAPPLPHPRRHATPPQAAPRTRPGPGPLPRPPCEWPGGARRGPVPPSLPFSPRAHRETFVRSSTRPSGSCCQEGSPSLPSGRRPAAYATATGRMASRPRGYRDSTAAHLRPPGRQRSMRASANKSRRTAPPPSSHERG